MTELKFTVDRPEPNTPELCQKRLVERDLLHGSAFVIKFQNKYYGGGDRDHNPTSISHNLRKLLEILRYGNWAYVGKAYDSDMYFSRQRITQPIIDKLTEYTKLEVLYAETGM